MTDEKFDQLMRSALSPRSADPGLNRRLKVRMEEKDMTKKNFRISMAAGVCGCLVLAGAAFAAVSAMKSYTVSTSDTDAAYTYDQLPEVEEELGFQCKVPEEIAPGFQAKDLSVVDEDVMNENEEVVYSYKTLNVNYGQEGKDDIILSIGKESDLYEGVPEEEQVVWFDEEREIEGVSVKLHSIPYMFVPVDYRPTEEEEAAMEKGELAMAYGTEEVEKRVLSSAEFVIEGLNYTIIDSNGSDLDAMFEMARAVITP